jgi:GNAT superfamily N-acetyltransferase
MAAIAVVGGIDRVWLEAAARRDPVSHAYAVWDLDHLPEMVHFVSCVRGAETIAYLLIWNGGAPGPIVHWIGDSEEAVPLMDRFPPRPWLAFVPLRLAVTVLPRVQPALSERSLVLHRPWSTETPTAANPKVRRLRPSDRPALEALVRRFSGPLLPSYATVNLGAEPVWGAFSPATGALEGVAKTAVRLPAVWIVTGVFVTPEARGQGLATALVAGLVHEATQAHAATALYVREPNLPARRAYEKVGFRLFDERLCLDAGMGRLASPP